MKILFNFGHSKVHNRSFAIQKSIIKNLPWFLKEELRKKKKLFHATPHIKSLYEIWIENQYDYFSN
jgi:hypothetical protein